MRRMRLDQPHEHEGRPRPIGEVIEVDDGTAAWLLAHGIARLETSDALPILAPESRGKPKRKSED
jgi:hypothetical protein